MATKTSTNKSRITPESKVIDKTIKPEPKTKKILMKSTYISDAYCLFNGNMYEIDASLADALIKNREATAC